eukprot:jgi/Psemu1/2255/gm1.2255_g
MTNEDTLYFQCTIVEQNSSDNNNNATNSSDDSSMTSNNDRSKDETHLRSLASCFHFCGNTGDLLQDDGSIM